MPDDIKLMVELGGFVVTLGLILWRLAVATTTFELIGQRQADEIREIKVSMEKMENAMSIIAVQDVKIASLMQRFDATDRRTDDRFARLEQMLDDMKHGRGFIHPSSGPGKREAP